MPVILAAIVELPSAVSAANISADDAVMLHILSEIAEMKREKRNYADVSRTPQFFNGTDFRSRDKLVELLNSGASRVVVEQYTQLRACDE